MTRAITHLGDQGLVVPQIGFGALALSGVYGPVGDADAIAVIQRAIELGMGFIDTADIYGRNANERLVGKAIRDRRDSVVLATKFGNTTLADGSRVVNGAPEYARQACEASLQRLGVDHIDLYYLHRVDKTIPIEETVGGMADLVRAGKVRYLGLSEASAATIRRAHMIHPITALQSEYSLWERGLEDQILPTIRELGIGLVAFSPLGRGFLAGAIREEADFEEQDARRELPRFEPENLAANLRILEELEQVAHARSTTSAQIALAWLLSRGSDIVAIPGTRRIEHLEENDGAGTIELTEEELAALDAAAPIWSAAGERYPPDFLARLDTSTDPEVQEADADGPR
jgi:aryl-alcohol dehydrogenase-like predicted oxidoreductase